MVNPISREEGLRELDTASEPFARDYRASIGEPDKEIRRLIDHLKKTTVRSTLPAKVRVKALGGDWSTVMIECYKALGKAADRRACLQSAKSDARDSPSALRLGLMALKDRSSVVRETAIQLLAYSLSPTVIPALRNAIDEESRVELKASLGAAINAIEKQNHHFYVDRVEKGNGTWSVRPWESREPAIQRAGMSFEIEKIRKAWETEV